MLSELIISFSRLTKLSALITREKDVNKYGYSFRPGVAAVTYPHSISLGFVFIYFLFFFELDLCSFWCSADEKKPGMFALNRSNQHSSRLISECSGY